MEAWPGKELSGTANSAEGLDEMVGLDGPVQVVDSIWERDVESACGMGWGSRPLESRRQRQALLDFESADVLANIQMVRLGGDTYLGRERGMCGDLTMEDGEGVGGRSLQTRQARGIQGHPCRAQAEQSAPG